MVFIVFQFTAARESLEDYSAQSYKGCPILMIAFTDLGRKIPESDS